MGGIQDTNGKDAAKHDFRSSGQLQAPDNWDGEDDNAQVAEDVECCIRVPECCEVDAGSAAADLLVESILYRCALEDAGENGADGECGDNADPGPASDCEPSTDEDSDV